MRARVLRLGIARRRAGPLVCAGNKESLGVSPELFQTTLAAEVVGLARVRDGADNLLERDGHATNGIDDFVHSLS